MDKFVVITVKCAFCEVQMDALANNIALNRDTCIARIKCGECDSIMEVMLQTKRRSKGRRFKATEKIAADKIGAAIAAARAENDKIALAMLAESGCTCGTEESRQRAALYGHERRDGLESGGTGREGIPLAPRHRIHCPVRTRQDQEEEQES